MTIHPDPCTAKIDRTCGRAVVRVVRRLHEVDPRVDPVAQNRCPRRTVQWNGPPGVACSSPSSTSVLCMRDDRNASRGRVHRVGGGAGIDEHRLAASAEHDRRGRRRARARHSGIRAGRRRRRDDRRPPCATRSSRCRRAPATATVTPFGRGRRGGGRPRIQWIWSDGGVTASAGSFSSDAATPRRRRRVGAGARRRPEQLPAVVVSKERQASAVVRDGAQVGRACVARSPRIAPAAASFEARATISASR